MNSILYNPKILFEFYLFIINFYGLIIMGIDKYKSVKRKYRIPERMMFAVALLGGGGGVYLGMHLFHHKTLHNKFRYGIPAIIIVNIICIIYIIYII